MSATVLCIFPQATAPYVLRCALVVVHSLATGAIECGRVVQRTPGILAPADLDELLDVGNFGRHFDGLWWIDVGDLVGRLA
jgi:hypothetical protein